MRLIKIVKNKYTNTISQNTVAFCTMYTASYKKNPHQVSMYYTKQQISVCIRTNTDIICCYSFID